MTRLMILFLSVCGLLKFSILDAKNYQFYDTPIDVVIPSVEKDLDTLELCIAGIKANCSQIRRVIVVSSKRLTDQAEWFDEANFPFSKKDIEAILMQVAETEEISIRPEYFQFWWVGWYYQQLLKLYSPFVIQDISTNVLILDSDTIFLNPVKFLDSNFAGLYNYGSEYHNPYFEHANRFLPGLSRLDSRFSGITHHMLFQYDVLKDLFLNVENYHGLPLWQVFCKCITPKNLTSSGASEYEIYFNFVFARTNQVQMSPLKWMNVNSLDNLDRYKSEGYDYVSSHSHSRN